MRAGVALAVALSLAGCGDDAGARDAGPDAGADAPPDECAAYVPPREPRDACGDPSADAPDVLVACERGSGHAGRWIVDGDGLPAYELLVDQRCDPSAQSWSPRRVPERSPLRDPLHLIGNGRGLMAVAHASGAVELYAQDRGHQVVNRLDLWRDPRDPEYPPQVGGGFSYVVGGGEVRSTRFEDLPVAEALALQSRRLGVGYVETRTDFGDVRVTRVVYAPDADARALVAEVTVESTAAVDLGLVEIWDVNRHQLVGEAVTSDLAGANITEDIDRRRRALAASFADSVSWDPAMRVATVDTRALSLPAGVSDRDDPTAEDWFPDPLYLAVLSDDVPDAVFLSADELWDGSDRAPPARAASGTAAARTIELPGEGQPALLALRIPLTLAAGEGRTVRFAFGYAPGGGRPDPAVAELRAAGASLRAATSAGWRGRLAWVAFPGLEAAGAVQREIAWSSYHALASVSFDELRGTRVLGQGGSYRFIHGVDGAVGDLCLFADAMLLVDPTVSRDTLAYALATQHGSGSATPWRYPYATTGVDSYTDVGIYDQRSDAYWTVPSSVARYVAATRDDAFLDREVPYWPAAGGEQDSVAGHLRRSMEYALGVLGLGARGIVAMGTNDYADGIRLYAEEPATPTGTSSTYNAGLLVLGLPLAADVVESREPALATTMRELVASQSAALESEAWNGRSYHRGFVDSGNPLAPGLLFLEPQVLPILAGLTDDARRDALLDRVATELETPLGAMSTRDLEGGGGGIAEPQIGGVWPVANAWLTEAYAMRDPAQGWSSFVRNTLARHAELYPEIWYGIWTGPDSYHGPAHERAGEADAHIATALTDYPVFNAHVHTGPLRALAGLLGVTGTGDGLRIRPRLPTEDFAVALPRLTLRSRPERIEGTVLFEVDGDVLLEIALPSALRAVALRVEVDGALTAHAVRDGAVEVTVTARAGVPVRFAVAR